VTPEPRPTRIRVEGHEAENPRRVGSLERGKPIPLASETLKGTVAVDSSPAIESPRGEARFKVAPLPVGGNTLEGRSPGELRARVSLTRWLGVADSHAEQSPEGEGQLSGSSIMGARGLGAAFRRSRRGADSRACSWLSQRHEGKGVGERRTAA
jgi:hypothetical protein